MHQALVGGVNVLLLSPENFAAALAPSEMLSADGRYKTFSAAATDGYGRAEGCAVVVVKRLSDAQRGGDRVLRADRGTAVNHDGASSGVTVPNGPAQQAVIRQALLHAGVAAAEVDFVNECHGTGTALGDPIEVQSAWSGVWAGPSRRAAAPDRGCEGKPWVTQRLPAGLAGLLKVVVALERGRRSPRSPRLGELNLHVPWQALPVVVPREALPWPRGERPRIAGVSSFGIGGTNAHVVLEQAPRVEIRPCAPERGAELFVVSAKAVEALDGQSARLSEYLVASPEVGLGDVAFSLATARSALEHRLAVTASSREGLRSGSPRGGARGRRRLAWRAARWLRHAGRWRSCSQARARRSQEWGGASTRPGLRSRGVRRGASRSSTASSSDRSVR